MQFKNLFQPASIGRLKLKNRISMTSINNSHLSDEGRGMINQRCVDYFVERARGGVGLLVTGVFKVENDIEKLINLKDGRYRWPQASIFNMPEYAEMANQVHSYGTKIF